MSKRKILCTLGPASFNEKTLYRFEELGVSLFRLNLSHTKIEDLEKSIRFIHRYSNVPICLDSEGAQVRTGILSPEKILLKVNEELILFNQECDDDLPCLCLNHPFILHELIEGDLLKIDFDSVLIQVICVKDSKKIKARVITPGLVGSNKAITSLRPITLPALTEKDKEAIEIGRRLGVECFALSFANNKEDVRAFRKLVGSKAEIISKIESKLGYKNLDEILMESDSILIDRGDFSREIPIELIPFYQEKIIKRANAAKKPVYIATNLLESMIEKYTPTRAEVNDIIQSLLMGADGLVLAAETAIGSHPIASASMIVKLINQFELSKENDMTENMASMTSLLVEPHGGVLVNNWNKNPDWDEINTLYKLRVSESTIMDLEQIGIGTYSPLNGFMTRKEIGSVLSTNKLPNDVPWTLPITLQKTLDEVKELKEGQTIAVVNEVDNQIYGTMEIKDIYEFPFTEICEKWFGTLDEAHPGVANLKNSGRFFVGGKITLVKRRNSKHRIYEFTPQELRYIFDSKGWSRVVGFHTRNVPHRGHEAIQKIALEKTHCDGLLISPAIGLKKKGDFDSDLLLKGYEILINNGVFEKDKVMMAALSTYSRYAGPREAVFTAICRKNFGCSHFIIGRDHTGVGNFYSADASQKLFQSIDHLGISPVIFDEIQFCPRCDDYVFDCYHESNTRHSISGSEARSFINENKCPPSWLMREEMSEMILKGMKQGQRIFS